MVKKTCKGQINMNVVLSRRLLSLVFVLVTPVSAPAAELPSMRRTGVLPLPRHTSIQEGGFAVDGKFRLSLLGYQDPRLFRCADRFLRRLEQKIGIPLAPEPISDPGEAAFEIHCSAPANPIQGIGDDESYRLEVTSLRAHLSAPTPLGVIRGLETVLQLVELDGQSFFLPLVTIEDQPRFCWRGLLVDVCRHWMPLEVIKRNLDAMAAVKMNVFHWHLSDDQGFRVESKLFPKLHQLGSDGNYYSQDEIRDALAYARDRGIRVIPEFDMPGHTSAWLAAYPELAAAPGPYRIARTWGVFDPCMDPTQEKLYDFLDSFIGEMASLFPDEYFHIGGDEVNGRQWSTSPTILAFKKRRHIKDNRELQAYFNQRLAAILGKYGKRIIGWDEILRPGLAQSVIIQSWRGHAFLADSVRQGYGGILSHGYYLDHMETAAMHYKVDPLGEDAADLSEPEKARILGGEACMWGEFVAPENIDSRIWPRTAAIAERLWSSPEVNDVQDMYRRLERVAQELELLGLTHRTSYRHMLQRISGDQNFGTLKTLADLLQPVGIGTRHRTRKYTSMTPLNRLVDAVSPESATARLFADLVDRALTHQHGLRNELQEIRHLLIRWRDNHEHLSAIANHSFLLTEAIPLSETVQKLSNTGLCALDYVDSGQKPAKAWHTEQLELLDLADKPQAELLPAIVASIKRLVAAASASLQAPNR